MSAVLGAALEPPRSVLCLPALRYRMDNELVIEIDPGRFEEMVAVALDGLPEELGRLMSNVAVTVEHRAGPPGLLGLYEGVPLTSRTSGYAGVLPDRITIYRQGSARPAGPGRRPPASFAGPSSTRSRTTSASTTGDCANWAGNTADHRRNSRPSHAREPPIWRRPSAPGMAIPAARNSCSGTPFARRRLAWPGVPEQRRYPAWRPAVRCRPQAEVRVSAGRDDAQLPAPRHAGRPQSR
jgi:hypothetical protein